jgi:cyclase
MERELKEGGWAAALDRSGFQLGHLARGLDFDPPMVTFKDRLEIRYGGRLFQMIYIDHCHTKGDSVVWMPEEKILFAGDLLANRSHPPSRQGNFGNWMRAIPQLKKFPARRFIPGHEPLPAPGSGIVDENKTYFDRLRRRAAAALKKESAPKKAAALVKMPEYARWTRAQNAAVNAENMVRFLKWKG